jgi:hypothetical protein
MTASDNEGPASLDRRAAVDTLAFDVSMVEEEEATEAERPNNEADMAVSKAPM